MSAKYPGNQSDGVSLSDVRRSARIFISHSNNDHALAMEVCALLEARGLPCWIGPRDVVPGKVWDEAILDAIDSTSIFLLVLSSAANKAPFVKNEVNRAFTLGKPILTFRVEDVQPGRSLELYLARHHWTDGFSGRIEDRVEELARAIAALPAEDGAVATIKTEQPAASKPKLRTLSSRRERVAWAVATGCALLAVGALTALLTGWRPGNPPLREPIIASLDPPADATLLRSFELGAALSPDGRKAVFSARTRSGERQLFVRDLSSATPRALPGTTGGYYPFWSPDGLQVGFFADGKLKKLDLRGSAAQVLADAPQGRGGTWNREDVILFSRDIASGLYTVSASGGPTREVARAKVPDSYRWPAFLPDGQHFVFLAMVSGSMDTPETARLMLANLQGDAPRLLLSGASNPQYVDPGYLLFGRKADLLAVRLDMDRLEIVGEPMPVPVGQIAGYPARGLMGFSASDSGALLFLPSSILERESRLLWVDRRGNLQGSVGPVDRYFWPRLSPDGSKIATVVGEFYGESSLWLTDVREGRRLRLSRDARGYNSPAWLNDSKRIVFGCRIEDVGDLCIKSLDDGADMRMIYSSGGSKDPGRVLADGRTLVYVEQFPGSDYDIMRIDLAAPKPSPTIILKAAGSQEHVDVSPDGRWVAYVSDESGNREVYVRPTSGAAQQWQVSTAGGFRPRWTRGGRELLFAAPSGDLMSVQVAEDADFRPPAPTLLFRLPEQPETDRPIFEDVTADGERLLLNVPTIPSSTFGFRLVTNWPTLLEQPKDD